MRIELSILQLYFEINGWVAIKISFTTLYFEHVLFRAKKSIIVGLVI